MPARTLRHTAPFHEPTARRLIVLALATAAALAPAAAGAATAAEGPDAKPVPLEAFGRLPTIHHVALSTDGARLAFILTVGERQVLDVVQLDNDARLGQADVGTTKVREIAWADNRHVLITSASSDLPFGITGPQTEWHLIQSWDADSKKIRPLLGHVRTDREMLNVVTGEPVAVRTGADTLIYVESMYFSEHSGARALVRINLSTDAENLVKEGSAGTQGWIVNDRGEIVAEQDYFDQKHHWSIRVMKDGRTVQTASGTAALDYPEIAAIDADDASLIVRVRENGDLTYRRLSLADASWGSDFAPDYPFSGFITNPGSNRAIGASIEGDEPQYHFFDAEVQRRWDWVERVFHGERVRFIDMAADHQHFLVEVLGPKSGFAYYIADAAEHLTRKVGAIYAGVPRVAEVRKISYPAADGLQIPAYLTLPPGRAEKGLPLIVMPHGGPESRDELGFDWWAQALAAQGYAVLQPNFRGSSLTVAWIEKGYGEWGRKMQTYLSDGVGYLAQVGIVDPARVCIVGGSYGGYAAMAGAALQPGTYRCAVALAGISDPESMLRWEQSRNDHRDNEDSRYWNRFMGVAGPNDSRLAEISPLVHAASIVAPLMLIHGKDDITVPYEQSARMAKALENLRKPVEFVTLAKEDHYLSRSETRLQMLTASVAFLRRNNPPD